MREKLGILSLLVLRLSMYVPIYVCVCMYVYLSAYEHARVCRLGIAGCCRIAWYYYRRSLHRLASRLSLCRSFLDRSETLFFLVNEPAKKIDRKGNR